jgi:predicted RNA-binding protein with PIN domain
LHDEPDGGAVTWWVVDGNNVMGAGADGWWNDPVAAAGRLAQQVAAWSNAQDGPVTLVFDGKPEPSVAEAAGGNLEILFATRSGRDAADDRIVAVVEERYAEQPDVTVVTSDKGLAERLPPGVSREGAGAFRDRIGVPRAVHPGSKRRGGR